MKQNLQLKRSSSRKKH